MWTRLTFFRPNVRVFGSRRSEPVQRQAAIHRFGDSRRSSIPCDTHSAAQSQKWLQVTLVDQTNNFPAPVHAMRSASLRDPGSSAAQGIKVAMLTTNQAPPLLGDELLRRRYEETRTRRRHTEQVPVEVPEDSVEVSAAGCVDRAGACAGLCRRRCNHSVVRRRVVDLLSDSQVGRRGAAAVSDAIRLLTDGSDEKDESRQWPKPQGDILKRKAQAAKSETRPPHSRARRPCRSRR